jgi:hypothetical protein
MNTMGFSKLKRQIKIYDKYLQEEIANIFRPTSNTMLTITGSPSEGLCGGIYNNPVNHDTDLLFTIRNIKLCPPRRSNINNPPLLHDNEDHDASFFVEEGEEFPGYVKLSLAKEKTNCVYVDRCKIMYDDKWYLSNSRIMEVFNQPTAKGRQDSIKLEVDQILELCEKRDINGPAHTNYFGNRIGFITKIDIVHGIHHDLWPNSAYSFITRRKPNNWPSNSMLENIKSQGYDVAPVGHHDSQNKDIQWRIFFLVNEVYF